MTAAAPQRLAQVNLIVAPEGFGKGEAVREMLVQDPGLPVHFCPREDPNSLYDLVYGLVQALGPAAPGLGSSYAGAAEYARQCAEPEEELGAWLARHLQSSEAVIVLHDLDTIDKPEFYSLLARVIEASGSSVHWICVARTMPPLPWETWRAYGLFGAAVMEDRLRLTRSYALDCAREAGCPPGIAADLYDRTCGWPLGFKSALRAWTLLGEPVEPATPLDTDEAYTAFARRIFEHLEPEIKEFLIQCSIAPEFDPAMAAAAGRAAYWPHVAEIADDGLLLVHKPYGLVRYRDSLRGYLRGLLAARGAAAERDAVERIAHAYELSGRSLIALRLYAQSGSHDQVLRLCETQGFALIEHGHVVALNRVLNSIPAAELHGSAIALAIKALGEAGAGRHDIAEAWFLQAIGTAQDRAVKASIAYRYGLDLLRNGRLEGVSHLAPFADDAELEPNLRASIKSTLATAHVLNGRFDEARETIEQALETTRAHPDVSGLATVLQQAAWVALFTGEVEKARTLALQAAGKAVQAKLYECAARAYSVLYNIACDIDDEPEATRTALECILDFAAQAGSAPMRLFALLGMYDLATERGDGASLTRLERSMLSYDVTYSDPMTSAALLSGQALMLAGRGAFKEAFQLLLPTAERQLTPDRCALRYSELALYAAAANQPAAAQDALERLQSVKGGLPPEARRTIRTHAYELLANMMLGNGAADIAGFDHMAQRSGMSARTAAFVEAVKAVATRWSGTLNRAALSARLEALKPLHLGGYAAVLSALPLDPGHRPSEKTGKAQPGQISSALSALRERVIETALTSAVQHAENSLLADLIAGGTVDQLRLWETTRSDQEFVRWADVFLEEHPGAGSMAHCFGDAVHAAAGLLFRHGLLDRDTDAQLRQLRQTLDAHVSAFQIRSGGIDVAPLEPVDAKIDELLNRLAGRDPITSEHSRCVGAWCARLARRMHLTRNDSQLVTRCGLIHDIGKVLTPPPILQAPRKLNDEEWETMKRHAVEGARLIEPIPELRPLVPAVRWHHERYDGEGYPDRIPLSDIPFTARMVSVADAFNAMIARRPYREPLSPIVAIEQLRLGSGSQFDPAVVDNMIDVVLHPDR